MSKSGTPVDNVVYGRRPVLEMLKAGRPVEKVFIAQGLAPSGVLGEIRKRSDAAGVPVRVVPKDQVDRLAAGNHQGVAAITGRYRYAPLDELFGATDACVLFLDGVTDPHNLGSLLRSADSAGFQGVVIPAHRSVGVTGAVRRVSAGAAEVVPVARVPNLSRAIDEAKTAGLWILGLDEKAEGDLWNSDLVNPPVGLVLGAEDRGISRNVREHCDGLVRIPHTGRIGSLNVAVAGAVAMFEVARRRALSA
ncbi:MAG: 23S rRNA (guanosine(2251)-2'-O)-methyltransferase RlmB [Actinomycetota bacterium]